jgi:predicted metal-dependent HD superfamily phosphohydrolase
MENDKTTPIIEAARTYAGECFQTGLTTDHQYHHQGHTERVCKAVMGLGKAEGLSDEQLEILELAAIFHDLGFTETYEGHEAVSRQLANSFLESHHYPEDKKEQVLDLIDVTFPPKVPQTLPEKVICDADLSNLGSPDYLKYLTALRHEWKTFLNQEYTDEAWYKLNYKFVKSHRYYTAAAVKAYDQQWNTNRKQLKKLRDEHRSPALDKKKQSKPKQPEPEGAISNNKSAQTMFKTSLRNHLDLSALADNKANIMLSVNALIVTIVMPLASSYVGNHPPLIIPMLVLLITCLTSMVFATLATRPIKMEGETSKQAIDNGTSNLFFFGNFYKMDFPAYESGMLEIVSDNKKLDRSIMRDLYFLGRSLGRKYRLLRICYTIFMIGIISTVLAYGLLMWISPPI